MHVAMNGWFWTQQNTGSGQYVRRLVSELAALHTDLQITLVLPPHAGDSDDIPDNVQVLYTGNTEQSSRVGKVLFEQRVFPGIVNDIRADIAHIPYWGTPLSCRAKIVTSLLDIIPLLYPQYATGIGNRFYYSLVESTVKASNHIITLSEVAKLDIEEHLKIPEPNISVTYLAPADELHPLIGKEQDEVVRAKYNLPDRFVLYLGSYEIRKRVNDLLLAYTYVGEAEGDNYPLVLAGKEPDWNNPLFPDLRTYAKKLAIEDYVQWIGYVDEADKPALYRLADVFVYPSEYEGFGLQPLEAMASGTPVIVNDIDVMAEVLEDAAYLVDNARSMGGAIIALLLQKPFRDAMINRGLALATQYRWRKTAEETLQVYESVMR